jgi:beta-1,4-mannosyltransferase
VQGQVRGRDAGPARVVGEALAAIRQLEALGQSDPIVLAYHPVARLNPYQSFLYSRAWEHGVAAIPLARIEELDGLPALSDHARLVLHLHWLNLVLRDVERDDDARAAIAGFVERIDRFTDGGGRLIWSIHNVLPHDARMPEHEARLRQAIAERAAIVHVLTDRTREAIAGLFAYRAERELHVPMPSFFGAYADHVSRAEARYELSLTPDETVYAAIGAIRPYKGLTDLIDAFDALLARDRSARRLVIAGAPGDEPAVNDLLARCLVHPFVSLHAYTIPPDDMQLFLRAADVAVVPYLRSLNSASLMLALTFGVPAIVADVPGLADVVTPAMSRTFRTGDLASLVDALAAADGLRTEAARDAALAIARDHDAAALSDRFFRGMRERLAAPGWQWRIE